MSHTLVEFLVAHPDAACVLFVHPDVRVIQTNAQELAVALGVRLLSVGRELSAGLHAEPARAYPSVTRAWLRDTAVRLAPGPILLVDIDLLFEPALALDPVALLRSAGRAARLVVFWPGTFEQETLAYGVPEHGAYRTWRRPGLPIRCLT